MQEDGELISRWKYALDGRMAYRHEAYDAVTRLELEEVGEWKGLVQMQP